MQQDLNPHSLSYNLICRNLLSTNYVKLELRCALVLFFAIYSVNHKTLFRQKRRIDVLPSLYFASLRYCGTYGLIESTSEVSSERILHQGTDLMVGVQNT